jgi:branched-chain amino acid transport system substrate-binding protein
MDVEIVSADHQNKADIGASLARKWYQNDGVTVILDVPNSAVALAVNSVAANLDHVLLISSAASSDLTGSACSPRTIQWTFDTWSLGNATGREVTKQGNTGWYFVTADYAFGHALYRDASAAIVKEGGRVIGETRAPFNTADFSSFLLRAQSTKANVIAFANSGADIITAIKQADEFGIDRSKQRLVALLAFITDIEAIGLKAAQGLIVTEAFYWDLNDATRAWTKRFMAANSNRIPTMDHAGVYGSLLHYLKAVAAAKTTDAETVMKTMKSMPTDDPLFGKGYIREDGRKIHDMYIFEVKKPSESKNQHDIYRLLKAIPGDQAFRPLVESDCPLVKK